jgi:predicted dehydrogenase
MAPVSVGIVGCGEVAQIVWIPTLNYMSDYFRITYLCDLSEKAMLHCQQKCSHYSPFPSITKNVEELCNSPQVDLVLVLCSTEFHTSTTCLALRADKDVFVEKPMAMNDEDLARIIEAEAKSEGTVMVGYMRRYATAFLDAVQEIGGMDQVCYAVVSTLSGRNNLLKLLY